MNAADRQRIYVEGLKAKVHLLEQAAITQKSELERRAEAIKALDEQRRKLIFRTHVQDAEIARLRTAIEPFATFAKAFNAHPVLGVDDILYGIHGGRESPSGIGADLRLSDCRAALKALE